MNHRCGFLAFLAIFEAVACLGLGACGSRTGLSEDGAPVVPGPDARSAADGASDGGLRDGRLEDSDVDFDADIFDATLDDVAIFDATLDVDLFDAVDDGEASDASTDADIFDAPLDQGIDALPPIDASPFPDVVRTDCPDAAATLIYVVTEQEELFSFYPPSLTFTRIGKLVCPAGAATPYSMAVDRRGKAYVVYSDGNLFAVSTATAACIATAYVPGQGGFTTFGMGFASDINGSAETLFVAKNTGNASVLAGIDTIGFGLNVVGPITPTIARTELTGTGEGRLFGFFTNPAPAVSGSRIIEIDKATATTVGANDLPVGGPNDAWAFAYWGGDFWIFTSPGGATKVSRFRPSDTTTVDLTTHPSTIVGAGVSTCAPQ